MATRIQVRRDTAANWAAAPTTVLASGEIGFETDTLQFKIGDGTAQWQNLEYAGGTTPIIKNAGGTDITDLNDASLRNKGNAKYLILGADTVGNDPAGLTTATDGQLLVTVAKYDYLGTSAANERFLMTLTTLTTNKTYYRTYDGSRTPGNEWSAWYLVITADASGNATVPGDLAVNGGDITTSSTGTATVFNTNATTLNVGQAATTVSIGATTGTATIRNATTAITGDATVGGSATVGTTLGVTGNTTLTGDLAVNGGDITTSAATATVFDSNATSVDIAGAATTLNIADTPTTNQTINIGTGITASGATKTINIGTGGATGSTTNINLGDSDGGTVVVNRALTVSGLTTLSGGLSLASSLASSAMASGSVVGFTVGFINDAADTGIINGNPATTTVSVTTSAFVPKLSSSTIFVFPIATYGGSIPATETGLEANIPGWMTVQWSGDSNSREGWSNTASASAGGTITSILSNQRTMPANGISSGSVSIVNVFSQQNTSTASRTYTVTLAFTDAGAGSVTGIIGRPQVAYVIAEVAP